MEQTSLAEALSTLSSTGSDGVYILVIPASTCIGAIALGGFILSYVHKAAIDYTTRLPKSAKHRHVQQLSSNFFRPSLAAPVETTIRIDIANVNRAWTTLHFQTLQNGKACTAGYVMLTDLVSPAQISAQTGWQLTPPPADISIDTLEADNDPSWVGYVTPWKPKGFRNAQSYAKWHIPVKRAHPSFIDQWISPGWPQHGISRHADSFSRSVWTDELVHFVVDSVIPLLPDLMFPNGYQRPGTTFYGDIFASGVLQRRLRAEGKDDRVNGVGMEMEEIIPWIISTLSMSTEIKKILPESGVKWLFARTEVKYLLNDRMSQYVTLLDETGDLVATSQQILQVIPMSGKVAKQKEKQEQKALL